MFNITKKYHFYAAHRNPEGGIKCGRIHGHTYRVKIEVAAIQQPDSSISILFQDIDTKVEPIIKSLDHFFIIWDQDPLLPILEEAGERFYVLPFVTSAENLASYFWEQITQTGLNLVTLTLEETESSAVTINSSTWRHQS